MKTTMTKMKMWMWPVVILAVLLGGCVGPVQKLTPADMSITRPDAESIVVVHSRSGFTAHLAQRISEAMNADYVRLDVPEGSQESLLSAPKRDEMVETVPQKIDLAPYRIVFLGSPVWFWHPTAFIYSFIKNNDFESKKVVLFYTFQGGIADDAVDEWKGLVRERGGTVIDVVGIDRSGLKEPEAFKSEVSAIIERQKALWLEE